GLDQLDRRRHLAHRSPGVLRDRGARPGGVHGRQIRRASRGKEPLLDLRPLTVRTYTVSLAIIFIAMANMLGTVIVLPIYLTGALGVSSLNVGLTLLPGAVASGVLGPFVGRLYDRIGPRPLVV